MNNAEWCIKQGYKFRELTCKCSKTGNRDYDILLNNKCIGTVKDSYSNRAITTWLDMEHVEPILDDAEKRYLSAVIRPFRNKVKYITKISCELIGGPSDYYFIIIGFVDEYFDMRFPSFSDMRFPSFSKDTMYKGMQLDHKYTLEELGL